MASEERAEHDREDPRTVATPNTNGAWTDLGSDETLQQGGR